MKSRKNKWGDLVVKKNFELPETKLEAIRQIAVKNRTTDTEIILKAIDDFISKESN